MALWELIGKEGRMTLFRDGRRVVGLGGSREWAEQELDMYREQERKAREALATGDPLAVCRLGWHRGPLPESITDAFNSPSQYFRFGAKIGEAGGTLVYRVAEKPFEYLSRTVKCLGILDPWICAVCGEAIDFSSDS